MRKRSAEMALKNVVAATPGEESWGGTGLNPGGRSGEGREESCSIIHTFFPFAFTPLILLELILKIAMVIVAMACYYATKACYYATKVTLTRCGTTGSRCGTAPWSMFDVHVQRLSGVWAPMRPDPHYNHPPSGQSPNDGMIMMR
jgi:hypothetical protein